MTDKLRPLLLVLFIITAFGCDPISLLGSGSSPAQTPAVVVPSGSAFQLSGESKDTVIKLTWPAVSGARGYLVYRDGNTAPLNGDNPVTTTSFEDIGLTNGRTYTYTVSALDSTGKSIARSAETRASPAAK